MSRSKTSLFRTVSLALLVIGLTGIAEAQTRAYVAQFRAQQVSVIDVATNTVVAAIPVGTQPFEVLLSPDGSRAYVTNVGLNSSIEVIDTATNTVVASIPAPHVYRYMAISPDGTRLYVPDRAINGAGVTVIDTATNSVVATIPLPGTAGNGLAVTPDGAHLYIASQFTGDIFIAETATNTVVDTISDPAIFRNEDIALSPDGSRLYAGSDFEFRTIDTATKTKLASFEIGGTTLTVTPDGAKVIMCGAAIDGGPFWVDDTATNTVTEQGSIDVFSGAWAEAAATPDSAYVYVSDYLQGRVVVFDAASFTEVAEIPLDFRSGVRGIAIGTLPPTTPFAAFTVSKLQLNSQGVSEAGNFALGTSGTQSVAATTSTAIDPVTQPVTFTIGGYVLTIPAGSFRKEGSNLHWKFIGTLNDVKLNIDIKQHGNSTTQFDYVFDAKNGPVLTGLPRPIRVSLKIGRNVGSALVP
jgi:YVTN family beta-propeller protein